VLGLCLVVGVSPQKNKKKKIKWDISSRSFGRMGAGRNCCSVAWVPEEGEGGVLGLEDLSA
jgi:hypothetical protein